MIFLIFLHLNTINKQFIRLCPTKKSGLTVLFCLFKLLHLLLSSFQNFTWKVRGHSKVFSFQLSSIGHDFFTLRIFQKMCDYLWRFTIGRNTLSNTMNALEFDLVCIFQTKLCFQESNQNPSRILLRIGFFFNSKKTKIFLPLVYFHV